MRIKLVIIAFISIFIVHCSTPEEVIVKPPVKVEEPKDWRTLANERIDLYRKSDLTISVQNSSGATIANAKINVVLKRHKFKFGAVVSANTFNSSPYSAIYKENFLKYFNASGFVNALKPKQRGSTTEANAVPIMEWFKQNNIPVRGHALQWEGIDYLRPEIKAVYNDPQLTDLQKREQMITLSEVHFNHAIEKWDVICWDVCNEMINNSLINDLAPSGTFSYWFKLADQLRKKYNRPDTKLYMNDYQIISAIQPWAQSRPETYRALLDKLIAEGAPIEGIGFQSRFKSGRVEPEVMYKRLQDFEKYKLPYQATEFEIVDEGTYIYTDAQRKQIVNEVLTVYFSHPNVDGIWCWSYNESTAGSGTQCLFKYDGTPYATGKEWIRMMEEDFNTNVSLTTDAKGVASVRGFKGTYEIMVTVNNKTTTQTVVLDGNQNLTVVIN